MDRAIRRVTASREDLREGIARQRRTIDLLTATVVRLEARGAQPQATTSAQQALSTDLAQRVADLERQPGPGPGSGTPKSFPSHQPQQAAPPHSPKPELLPGKTSVDRGLLGAIE